MWDKGDSWFTKKKTIFIFICFWNVFPYRAAVHMTLSVCLIIYFYPYKEIAILIFSYAQRWGAMYNQQKMCQGLFEMAYCTFRLHSLYWL